MRERPDSSNNNNITMSKQYINEFRNLVEEERRYIKRYSSETNHSIQREGYFYSMSAEAELMIEDESNTDSELHLNDVIME